MLSGLARSATGEQREKAALGFLGHSLVRMGIQPGAVAAEGVHEKKLGSQRVRGHASLAQLREPLLEQCPHDSHI
jgi:hypothetical protein